MTGKPKYAMKRIIVISLACLYCASLRWAGADMAKLGERGARATLL